MQHNNNNNNKNNYFSSFFIISVIIILIIWFIRLSNTKIKEFRRKIYDEQLLKIDHVLITMDVGADFRFMKNKFKNNFTKNDLMKLLDIIDFFILRNIKNLTFFIFSENFLKNYSKENVDKILESFLIFIETNCDLFISKGVKIKFLGNLSALNPNISARLNKIENYNYRNLNLVLNFLIAYNPEKDLLTGIKKITHKTKHDNNLIEKIEIEDIYKNIETKDLSDIDIAILTVESVNLSELPILQTRNAEIVNVKDLWYNSDLFYIKNIIKNINTKRGKLIY